MTANDWRGWVAGLSTFVALLFFVYVVAPYCEIKTIHILGVHEEELKTQIEMRMGSELHKKFWRISLKQLQHELSNLPWVEKITIRQKGLSILEVRVLEHQPIARWHLGGTFIQSGKWLPVIPKNTANLPLLTGPEHHRDLIFTHFLSFKTQLDALNLSLVAIELAPRGAWELHVQQGFSLILGREEMMRRLQRFVWSYDKVLRERASEIKYVDLRYTSGMAIGWRAGRTVRLSG